MTERREGYIELGNDVRQLNGDVCELKQDVGKLKTDVGELKTDVGELKTDVGKLSSKVEEIHKAVVGSADERQLGILPRLRVVERFVATYRVIILSVVGSLLTGVVLKIMGAW